ncbi:MAG: hypothetical protein ACYTXE_18015 [Nostoc sp.]
MDEKLHATCGMEFLGMGNRAWGRQCGLGVSPSGATAVMGKKLPMPYARSGGAAVPLHATCGIEFPAAFNEFGNDLYRNESIHSRNQAIAPQSS